MTPSYRQHGQSLSQRRTTELGDTVTTTVTIKDGKVHEDIVVEGPVELQTQSRREGAGKVWPSGDPTAGGGR